MMISSFAPNLSNKNPVNSNNKNSYNPAFEANVVCVLKKDLLSIENPEILEANLANIMETKGLKELFEKFKISISDMAKNASQQIQDFKVGIHIASEAFYAELWYPLNNNRHTLISKHIIKQDKCVGKTVEQFTIDLNNTANKII